MTNMDAQNEKYAELHEALSQLSSNVTAFSLNVKGAVKLHDKTTDLGAMFSSLFRSTSGSPDHNS